MVTREDGVGESPHSEASPKEHTAIRDAEQGAAGVHERSTRGAPRGFGFDSETYAIQVALGERPLPCDAIL